MPDSLYDRIRNAWNVFRFGEKVRIYPQDIGAASSYPLGRTRLRMNNERSIVNPLYTRIGIDVAAINIHHVRLDEDGRFLNTIQSGLNSCLSLEANVDQTGRSFIQDIVMSLCDEGSVAVVPVDTTIDPKSSSSYEIITMRTGKILQWHPYHVRLNVYNDRTGFREEILVPKSMVAIIENPLYAVMNEPNSTLTRLIEKLNLLDAIDIQSGSGKLDLIIQLPYVVKSKAREADAEKRRLEIETQLKDSKYGVAYIQATEKVVQLNRPAENNLMNQVEYLTSMLYSQLGLAKEVFDGTADEKTLLNYYNRTIEPVISSITDEFKRKFLSKTARSQGQSVMFIRDPFRLVPVSELAEITDKLTRNEVVTSNEIRGVIGFKPSKDPGADELRNKNINPPSSEEQKQSVDKEPVKINQNGRSS